MDPSQRISWFRRSLDWIVSTAATVLLTGLLLALHSNGTASGITYLVLVVLFASQASFGISIYLAVISAIQFDYFFLEPVRSFTISSLQDWLALIAFVLSCIVVGRVAERARRQTRHAERRREDVERLYALSQEMMLHEDAEGLVRDIPRLVERIFALDAVLLYVRESNVRDLDTSEPHQREPDQLYASIFGVSNEMRLALRALPATWEITPELPDGYVPMNLVFGMKSVGILAWKPATPSHEIATSVAAQVAIALTRSLAIEASARLEAVRSSERLRNALIDSLTHELRTPLTAIRAAATTLVDGHGLDAATRDELAAIVDEESARLDLLIGDAIEMAQIDANSIRVEPMPVHTRTVLDQAVEESRSQLASHQVSVSVEAPDTPVWLDPHLIGRVLRHLLENAARYTPSGSRIQLSSRRAPGIVEFAVEDNGPGIDTYDLPLIFEKFYRGKRAGSVAKGSGMGLAIARAILAAHGGTIAAESSAGKGTTFRLTIPIIERSPSSVR
jgi:two-component system sensor histidine kinase KdpD